MTQSPESFSEEILVQDAAKKYDLTPSQITKLTRAGTIRGRKIGRDWVLDELSLRAYVTAPRKPGPKPRREKKEDLDQYNPKEVTMQSQFLSNDTDWIGKAIECLAHAVKTDQLSEEGWLMIVAHIERERQFNKLANLNNPEGEKS